MSKVVKILLLLLMAIAPVSSYAQSAASKYDEGIALYKKGNYKGAIKALNESMALNASAAHQKKCQALIKKCKKGLSAKDDPSNNRRGSQAQLGIRNNVLRFPGNDTNVRTVSVTASGDWYARLEDESDNSWCEVKKQTDGSVLTVMAKTSEMTVARDAVIVVHAVDDSNVKKKIKVHQERGRQPTLTVKPERLPKISKRGKELLIKVECVSDTLYADGKNWEVVSYPQWVTLLATKTVKKGGFAGVIGEKDHFSIGNNELSVQVSSNPDDQEREGDLVLRSQDVECRVKLVQDKGKKKKK